MNVPDLEYMIEEAARPRPCVYCGQLKEYHREATLEDNCTYYFCRQQEPYYYGRKIHQYEAKR